MKTRGDFAGVIKLPSAERKAFVMKALGEGQIDAAQAAALYAGRIPTDREQQLCGTSSYAGGNGNATTVKPLSKNSAIYAMARDLDEGPALEAQARHAKSKIDQLLSEIGKPSADRAQALNLLAMYLGTIGPDVVDALRGSRMDAREVGLGYINSRLLQLGVETPLKPVMDARTRKFIKDARPGDLRGSKASIEFSFRAYSAQTLAGLQSQGRTETGMWSAVFHGTEAYNFRKSPEDGSVSAKIRDLDKQVSGGSLDCVLGEFVQMLEEQALPMGYSIEIDLAKVPTAQHAAVKAALAGLEAYGAELRYLETDDVEILDAARASIALSQRIDRLFEKPQSEWSQADWAEYRQVQGLYHGRAG